MTIQRNLFDAVPLDGKLYALAGNIACGAINTEQVESYDPRTDSWTPRASLPARLWDAAAAACAGRIYVFGGSIQGGALNHSVFVYNPAANAWARGTDFPGIAGKPNAVPASTAAAFGDRIFVMIYDGDGRAYFLWAYAPATGLWESHGAVPLPFPNVWEAPLIIPLPTALALVQNAEFAGQVHIALYLPDSREWHAVDASAVSYAGYHNVQAVGDGAGFYILGGLGNGHSAQAQYVSLVDSPEPPPAATNHIWIVTAGRDATNGRQIQGLSADGSTVTTLYAPTALPGGAWISEPNLDTAKGRFVFHVAWGAGHPSDGPLHWGHAKVDELQPLASSYLDAPSGRVYWVPGQDRVMFSNVGSGIHSIDLDPATADEQVITSNYFDEIEGIATTGKIYFENSLYRSPGDLFTMAWDGTGIMAWSPTGTHHERNACVSPDGQFVAFFQQDFDGLYLATATGVVLHGTTNPLVAGLPRQNENHGNLAWSPDSRTVAFVKTGDLWSIERDGTNLRQLTHGEFPFLQVWGAWAQDVGTLAVTIATAVEIAWPSLAGRSYQVQWASEVAPTIWQDLGVPSAGTGGVVSVFDSTRLNLRRIYRVVEK